MHVNRFIYCSVCKRYLYSKRSEDPDPPNFFDLDPDTNLDLVREKHVKLIRGHS
jgi:hypothetical protein